MNIDLSCFKVVYREKVLRALTLVSVEFKEGHFPADKSIVKPYFLEVVAINEDGNVIVIRDEAWIFQFIPIIAKGE